jgi:(p)ppGpp synthase/HD superfamily hydrolase
MTKKAIKLMFEKHKDQVDKSGMPYVFHPFHLAEQMDDEETTITALLHDIVEDTNTTFDDLRELGFSDNVINALKLMTHDKNVDYFEYVKNISKNPIARKVKIKDLEHNMDTSRLDEVTDKDLERVKKYKKCYKYLLNNN